MSDKIYTVHAYRLGNRENHSYLVGVYTKKSKARACARKEEDWRGGKYECEIREWEPDSINSDSTPGMQSKVIKNI